MSDMEARSCRQWLHRWRWWLVVLVVLVVVRIALPEALRRVIVSQASEGLDAQVTIGDVDLRLWRGGIALEDVAVREKGAPEPPPPTEGNDEKVPPPAFDAYSPIVGFKRFAVELHFLPLFSKTIQIRDAVLDAPRVALDRLASGDLNIMALLPQREVVVKAGEAPGAGTTPTAAAPQGAEEGSGWKFGLDKFVLTDGRIRFRDLAMEGSEPVEVGIDRISVDEIALTPAVYGEPARIAVKLGLDEGTIDVTANLTLNGAVVNLKTDVSAQRLPLRRARLYVPKVGWSELRGELDLDLSYELEAEKANALRGALALRDVAISVPTLEDAAVGWKSLTIDLDRIDLLGRRAAVREVALDGAVVAVRVEGGNLLPVLARRGAPSPTRSSASAVPTAGGVATETPAGSPTAGVPTASPAATSGSTAASASAGSAPAEPAAEARGESRPTAADSAASVPAAPQADSATGGAEQEASPRPTATPPASTPKSDGGSPASSPGEPSAAPWSWQLGAMRITESRLRVLSNQPPTETRVEFTAANLGSDANVVGHVTLGLGVAAGTVALDGDVRIAPVPAFGGTLKIGDLSLPALPVINRLLGPEAMSSGTLRSDLAITAGLPPPGGAEAPADELGVHGTVGLAALALSPSQAAGLTVELQDLELRIDELAVPGVIPPGHVAAAGATIDVAAGLTLSEPRVVRTGDEPLDVAVRSIGLEVPSLSVPAVLAGLGPGEGASLVGGTVGLDLSEPRITLGKDDMTAEAQRVALKLTDATVPALLPAAAKSAGVPPAEAEVEVAIPSAAEPLPATPISALPSTFGLQLDLGGLKVATGQGRELNATTRSIALAFNHVVVPGLVLGAPLAPSVEPLQTQAKLQVSQLRVARGDGKEFSIGAKSIDVPLESLALPGVPGGIPSGERVPSPHAGFGRIQIEAPVIRMTRRKEGIVLPVVAPSTAAEQTTPAATAPTPEARGTPAASQPLELEIAALRVRRGELDLTDRAVQPKFSGHFVPIEIDARNIELPGPRVKPLEVDITSEEQGHIRVRGDLAPDASTLEVKVDQLALQPFNPYAVAYSPYSIADGALSIETKVRARGGKYDVENDIRLLQFDLSGTEGGSLFEENFGMSLSMALALLRDVHGDINLSVPLRVDRTGNAEVDLMGVVRSALRHAVTGALTSPLKMLGAVVGGKGAPIAPSPVRFRLGRAEPTSAGAESAERLAAFLASRPAVGVQLSSAATDADERWLHEQALLGEWAEQGFFERSLAFVTQRGPRQRIRAYLEARAKNKKPKLSAEDAATLDKWLAERPGPTPEELQALADRRIAAVEEILRAENIDLSRVSRGSPPEAPGAPTVGVRLQVGRAVDSEPLAPAATEDE